MSAMIVIPARLASTRLPDKLLLAETGKPLICHTVDVAVQACRCGAGLFSRVIVATDHASILDAVNRYADERELPVRAVMTRADHACGTDRIAEVAAALGSEYDAIVNIQGDEPEMEPDEVVRLGRMLEDADMATLAYPIQSEEDYRNPNLVKVVLREDGRALYFSRSPIPYHRDPAPGQGTRAYGHVGMYGYRRDTLMRFVSLPQGTLEKAEKLEQLRALENGISIAVGVMAARPPKGIDAPEDYAAFVLRVKKA